MKAGDMDVSAETPDIRLIEIFPQLEFFISQRNKKKATSFKRATKDQLWTDYNGVEAKHYHRYRR